MKLCKDCKYYLKDGFSDLCYRKEVISLVTGEHFKDGTSCHDERYAGECGKEGKFWEDKKEGKFWEPKDEN